MNKLFFKLSLLCILLSNCYISNAKPIAHGDSIQVILQQLADLQEDIKVVEYLPETERWYLVLAHDEVPENLLESLQNAFLYDIENYCKYYAWKYLMDWRLLASKAARESFWGTSFLSNKTRNYFGIRARSKAWACGSFNYCDGMLKNDPEPSEFIVFPDFQASLWMFIHTTYSAHYLKRLPDEGEKVAAAIEYERKHGVHYWQHSKAGASPLGKQLAGEIYTTTELIYTWSEHEVNNLCINCDRATDQAWIGKIDRIATRI